MSANEIAQKTYINDSARDGHPTADGIEAWMEKARDLAPVIERYRDQAEQERRLPGPIFEAMRDAGFLRIWLPEALGGFAAGEETVARVVEEVSRHDASVGWNLAIAAESGAVWAFIPDAVARSLRDSDLPLAGSVNFSKARATPVAGGYRLSGRWPFASGCHQSGWVMGAALVIDPPADGDTEGRPRAHPNGEPEVRNFVLPRADFEIDDTWHVTGLRGTGSCDIVVEDVFVPEERQFMSLGPSPTPAYQPDWLYRAPITRLFGIALAAVGLGIARDAIDSFREVAQKKTPFAGKTVLEQQQTVHLRIGRAEALLRAARLHLLNVAHEVDAALRSGAGVDEALFVSAMLGRAQSVDAAVQAVDLVLDCAGTSSVFEGSRLERCSRDIRMIPRHISLSSSNLEMAGQYLMGGALQLRR